MRQIPNDIVKTLIRNLPIILDSIDRYEERDNLRLCNAVRLTKKLINSLTTIENEQRTENKC